MSSPEEQSSAHPSPEGSIKDEGSLHNFSEHLEPQVNDMQPQTDQTPHEFVQDIINHQDLLLTAQQPIPHETHEIPQDADNSDIDMDSLASFLNVKMTAIASIDRAVLQRMSGAISHLTELESEKMTLEVKLENVSHVSDKKVELYKKKLVKIEEENSELAQSHMSLQESYADLQKKVAELESITRSSTYNTQTSQSKVDEIVTENRQIMEILTKKNKEVDVLKAEYSELQEANSRLRKNVIALETSSQTANSNLSRANMTVQSLETRLELANNNHDWVSKELEKVSTQFSDYRKEKSGELSALQSELDRNTTDLTTLQLRYENVSSRFADASKKLDDTLMQVKALKDEKSLEQEEYLKEISVKERLVGLLQKSLEDAKSKIRHLEDRLDSSRSGVASESATLQTALDSYKEKLLRSEEKIKHLEDTIDEFSQASHLDPNNSSASLPPLSPSAKATAAKHSGLSLSQLYADFTLIKRQLTQERRAKERMQQQMDDFVNELEKKAPIISATKERANMLEKELTELSIILENTSKEKEQMQKTQHELTTKLQESQVEINGLRKQRADLARQVQHLVVQVTVRSDNGGPLTPAEKKAIERLASGDTILNGSDTDRLISDRLVTFQNIVELQKKNEDLLRIVRELGAKAESQEQLSKSRLENLESAAINEAKEAIVTLQDEVESAQMKLNAVTKERDMFRSLLSGKGDNNILSGDLSDSGFTQNGKVSSLTQKLENAQNELTAIHEQLERVKVESETTINILNKQINSLTTERSQLALDLAKERSSNELVSERYDSVQNNLKYTKSEIEELRKNSQVLQSNLARQEARAHETAEQLTEAKSMIESLRSESMNLKHEKEIWKSIEDRLKQENSSLTEEKNRLNTLLMNLQFVDKEREERSSEAQRRWTSHTESIEKELATVRTRLTETSDELKEALSRKEADSAAFRDRIDALRTELSLTREELITKKADVQQLTQKVQTLTSKLTSAESRLEGFQTITNSEISSSDVRNEALKLKVELDDARAELDDANRNVAEFKSIAAATEDALNSLTASYDGYKESTSQTIEKLEAANKQLTREVEILREQVGSLNNELDEQRTSSKKELMDAQTELEQLRSKYEDSVHLKADYDAKVALIEESFQQQAAVASEAQQNYEKELQKHAEATAAYASLRQETNAIKETINDLTTQTKQAKENLAKSQDSWDAQKAQLEEELRVATARVQDLTSQNHLLYNQIETLNKRSSDVQGVDDIDADTDSSELRELITLLRREKAISDTQLEVATRDLKRARQQLELTTSELDKTRMELVKSQSRDSDLGRITQEYEKLQKDLEQLNLLRESNVTLRNELKTNVSKVQLLEERLSTTQNKVQPLETEVVQLKAEITHKAQEIKLVVEERDRWRQRSQDILNKYDRIDPEEHTKLQATVGEMTKKLEEMTKKLEGASKTQDDEYKKLQDRFDNLRVEAQEKLKKSSTNYKALQATYLEEKQAAAKELEEAKAHSQQLQSEVDSLKAQVSELNEKLKSATGAQKVADETKDSTDVDALTKEIEVARQQLDEQKKKLEASKEFETKFIELQTLNSTLENKVSALESQVKKLTADLEDAKKVSSRSTPAPPASDQSVVIAELNTKLEKAVADLEAAKSEAEQSKTAAAVAQTSPEPRPDVDAALREHEEKLRGAWEEELKKEVALAEERLKKSIRLPAQEKLERLAEARTKSLEEQHEKAIASLKEEFEKKLASADGHATPSNGNLTADYESKIAELKKEIEDKAYEEGRKATLNEVNMRTKLLQNKIDKLTKAKQDLEKKLADVEQKVPESPAEATVVPEKQQPAAISSLPEKPILNELSPAPGSVLVMSPTPTDDTPTPADQGVKRHASEGEDGHQDKKTKSEP